MWGRASLGGVLERINKQFEFSNYTDEMTMGAAVCNLCGVKILPTHVEIPPKAKQVHSFYGPKTLQLRKTSHRSLWLWHSCADAYPYVPILSDTFLHHNVLKWDHGGWGWAVAIKAPRVGWLGSQRPGLGDCD